MTDSNHMALKLKSLYQHLDQEPPYRKSQALRAIFKELAHSWDDVLTLPQTLRHSLNEVCPLELKAVEYRSGEGGTTPDSARTIKAGFDMQGETAEAVLMRQGSRNTVCVSSQAGCAMGCDFCATGRSGFRRHLSADEIISQILYFARFLGKQEKCVTNVVYMGMGEPFNNYQPVIDSLKKLNSPEYFGLGARNISVSTVGVVPGIKRIAKEMPEINLAVSLHAPDDKLRDRLMPINKKYPLRTLLNAVQGHIETTRRKVMIEYLLLDRINDSAAQARQLAELLKDSLGRLYMVNLIAYNEVGDYRPASREKTAAFKSELEKAGVNVVERYRFGRDIKAACGQLAGIKNQ